MRRECRLGRKAVSGIMLVLLTIGMLSLAFNIQPVKAEPTTIIVPDDYPTIQEAINAAKEGDTIFVEAGTYYEHVVVSKTVSLVGENKSTTVVDGNWRGTTVTITANNVSVSGFTIQHGHLYGIHLVYSVASTIIDNVIIQNDVAGITFSYSNSNRIEDNIVASPGYSYLDHSYGNVIANNTINLSLWYSDNNMIINNEIAEDSQYGIGISNSNNNTVQNNTISTGYYSAISLWEAFYNKIAGNVILPYEGTSIEVYNSIHVDKSSGNIIRDNLINSNYTRNGVSLVGNSTNNTIVSNTIAANKRGVFLWQSSENIIYHNNIINNTEQVHDISWDNPSYSASINTWDDGYPSGGNYWSDYNGTDLYSGVYQNETGSDGIGDAPYIIDENSIDNYPLMNPWSPVTLTVIGPWAGTELDKFLPVLEAFEEKTGINVEYVAYRAGELALILPSMFEVHTTPGDLIFMWPWFIKEKGQEGHILEVTDLVNESDFSLGALDPVKVGDKLYGGAYTGKVKPGFWYRKSFFEAYGLTPPTTWDEFVALLNDIAAIPGVVNPIATGDGVGWPLSDIVEHFLITYGGPQLHKDLTAGTVSWNSSQVKAIFDDRIVPLLEAGYFSEPIEWTTALNLWWNGDYGLYFMGNWITEMVDDPDDLGVFTLPGAEGVVFGTAYFFIPTYTEHMDEAKQLFRFLASAEAQSIQVAQGGHIATNIYVPLDAYPPVDRTVAEAIEGVEVLPDLDDTIGGEFQVIFWDQLKLLWVYPASLDQVLDTIQAVAPKPPTPPFATATIDIDPDTLNLRSKGKWITAYIELPEGYNIEDINVSTIMLNDTVPAELRPVTIGDYDDDGIPDLMVKFERAEVISYIIANINVTKLFEERFMTISLTITGYLNDGIQFKGDDAVRIRMPTPRGLYKIFLI